MTSFYSKLKQLRERNSERVRSFLTTRDTYIRGLTDSVQRFYAEAEKEIKALQEGLRAYTLENLLLKND